MPVNPNFTNANRNTPYSPLLNAVPEITFTPSTNGPPDSDSIASGFNPFPGEPCVAVFQSSTGNLGPLQVGGNISVQQGGNGPSTALYRMYYASDNVTFATANTNLQIPMIQINPALNEQSLLNVSSITVSTFTANNLALMSSLKGTFPTSFV